LETLAGLRSDAPEKLEVDGRDIKEIGLYQLREWFALVPQDPMLLAGTIQDNLRIARPSLEEADLWDVLTTACLDKDVEGFPDGLQQWIGEGGLELSGGQRKRLALARGLLARRPWLLLDEPSEGLDESTERLLLTRLSKWLSNTSGGLLLVTHRPALLHLCDRKILLDERLGNRAQ
jgi:ATP-binding cassette subfamily C protein CydC